MNQTYMKDRPVLPLVLSMSLPMVLSMLVNSLYNIVDSFFVARISEDAMTALSLVYPIQNLINAVTIGFSIGVNAVISYYLGAQDRERAGAAAAHGLLLNALHGLILMAGSIAVMPVFLSLFTSGITLELGLRYSNIAFLFSVIIAAGMSYEKIFQAEGRMLTSMLCMLCGCLTNIILDPLMIFGIGPFPALGMEGAALATGTGQLVNLLLYIVIGCVRPLSVQIRWKAFRLNKEIALKIYAVGLPASLSLALPSLLISALNRILSAYSQSYMLVLGVYYKLQTFLYLPANGIVQGIRPLMGYNFGAEEHGRVREIYKTALALAAGIMALGTVLCWAVPGQLMGLFAESAETVEIGATALRIISGGFIVSAVSVISCGALEGLGRGGPSLLISLLRCAVLIIPAALLFSRLWGPAGVWHTFWITELLTAVFSLLLCRFHPTSAFLRVDAGSKALSRRKETGRK